MLWVYDEAIVEDLRSCIDPSGGLNNTVKIMGEDAITGILAQLEDDKIKFPAIFLERQSETPLDNRRYNFTRLHRGVPTTIDTETNTLYFERSAPIQLKYNIHVLTTNIVDMDELIKELLFRYSSMYFITAEVPYESKRKIRFGISINPDMDITKKSGNSQYVESGRLYESIIELECQGAVMLSYTPRHMQRAVLDAIKIKNQIEP